MSFNIMDYCYNGIFVIDTHNCIEPIPTDIKYSIHNSVLSMDGSCAENNSDCIQLKLHYDNFDYAMNIVSKLNQWYNLNFNKNHHILPLFDILLIQTDENGAIRKGYVLTHCCFVYKRDPYSFEQSIEIDSRLIIKSHFIYDVSLTEKKIKQFKELLNLKENKDMRVSSKTSCDKCAHAEVCGIMNQRTELVNSVNTGIDSVQANDNDFSVIVNCNHYAEQHVDALTYTRPSMQYAKATPVYEGTSYENYKESNHHELTKSDR